MNWGFDQLQSKLHYHRQAQTTRTYARKRQSAPKTHRKHIHKSIENKKGPTDSEETNQIKNTQKLKIKGVLRNLPHNPNNYADDRKEKRNESKRQAKQETQWPTIAISTAHLCSRILLSLSPSFSVYDPIPLLNQKGKDAESEPEIQICCV